MVNFTWWLNQAVSIGAVVMTFYLTITLIVTALALMIGGPRAAGNAVVWLIVRPAQWFAFGLLRNVRRAIGGFLIIVGTAIHGRR